MRCLADHQRTRAKRLRGMLRVAAAKRVHRRISTFDVPVCTITHFGIWNGSTFQGGFPLPDSITYLVQGTYVNTATTLWAV